MELLTEKGIGYTVVKEYSNGVRIGYVENHVSKFKNGNTSVKPNADIGQSWFPESWGEDEIRAAGTYVANTQGVSTDNPKFDVYNGVKVGIFVDKDNSPTTIFPNNTDQPKIDGGMEDARDD